jgi:hypothetical protein
MLALTRRRSDNDHSESWSVYYGGSASARACPSTSISGAGVAAFIPACILASIWTTQRRRSNWRGWPLKERGADCYRRSAGAFDEYRRYRELRAEIRAIHARGEKLPSEVPSSTMHCVCGVTFDSHKPAESYDHRLHIYATQAKTA